MNERQKLVVKILIPASLVLVWRVYALLTRTPAPPAAAEAAVIEPAVPVAAPPLPVFEAPKLSTALIEAQEKRLKLPWGRDPFDLSARPRPTVAATEPQQAPKPPDWNLTGISRDGEEYFAILGRRVVRAGDRIDKKYTVVEVTDASVTVTDGKWQYRYAFGTNAAESSPVEGTR